MPRGGETTGPREGGLRLLWESGPQQTGAQGSHGQTGPECLAVSESKPSSQVYGTGTQYRLTASSSSSLSSGQQLTRLAEFKHSLCRPGVEVHDCIPAPQEAEVGGSPDPGSSKQLRQHSKGHHQNNSTGKCVEAQQGPVRHSPLCQECPGMWGKAGL